MTELEYQENGYSTIKVNDTDFVVYKYGSSGDRSIPGTLYVRFRNETTIRPMTWLEYSMLNDDSALSLYVLQALSIKPEATKAIIPKEQTK